MILYEWTNRPYIHDTIQYKVMMIECKGPIAQGEPTKAINLKLKAAYLIP